MRGALLRLPDFDAHLAAAISGRSPAATELAVHLLKAAVQDANPPLAGPDLPASVDVSHGNTLLTTQHQDCVCLLREMHSLQACRCTGMHCRQQLHMQDDAGH